MKFIIIPLLCTSLTASFAQTIAVDKVVRNFLLEGLWADEHVISEHSTRSVSECAMKCRLTDTCASFFYRPVAPQCQLIPFIRYIPEFLIQSAGSKYYTLESATNFSLPPTPADPFSYNTFLLSDGSVTSFRVVNNAPESIDCRVKPCQGTSCAVLVDSRTTQVLHPTCDLQQAANTRVVQTRMNFTAAQDNCAADGATLARITTVPKMQLFQYILRSWGGNPELSDHWISGLPQGGQWVTELNEVIPPTRDFWLPGILSAYSNQEPELRVVMFYMSFLFNRLDYSAGLFSICEKL